MNFIITSPAFQQDRRIPDRFTCEGEDISPRLEWSGVPDSTGSFTLSCLDPDAPPGTWVHWVLYDLAADARSLDEGVPKSAQLENNTLQGACWGVDSFDRVGYYGPCPPPGHGNHRYYFGSMPWIWKPCLCRLTPPGSRWKKPWRVMFSEQRKPWALFPGNLSRFLRHGRRFRIRIYLFLFFVVISAVSPF